MTRAVLAVAFCSAAFGSSFTSITYNYTGLPIDRCNGTLAGSNNCPSPSVFDKDFITAGVTFSAPLAGNLSNANQITNPDLIGWTISATDGTTTLATLSSTDATAAAELKQLMLSTNASGGLTAWTLDISNLVHDVGGSELFALNPTIIGGGTGLPLADGIVFNGGGNGGIGPPGTGYNLGNSVPGSWTETLNGFQGGTTSSPVFLLGGNPIGGVTGSIDPGTQDYYSFNWAGGAFSASASISGAPSGATYLFSAGLVGTCNSLASETLVGPGFSGIISFTDLAAGQYCIGLASNSVDDFSLVFNTPLNATPEPSGVILLPAGLLAFVSIRRLRRQS